MSIKWSTLFWVMILLQMTFANAAKANILERIQAYNNKIVFIFNKLPKYRIETKNHKMLLYFENTKLGPNSFGEGLDSFKHLKTIDFENKNNDLLVKLETEKDLKISHIVYQNQLILVPTEQEENNNKTGTIIMPETTKKIETPLRNKKYIGKKISLDVQNADIQNVLRLLANIGGFNLVLSDDVRGTVTLTLRQVPWDQILDIILASHNLGMVKQGNVIRIAPLQKLQQEAEQLAQIKAALSKEEKVTPLTTEYLQVNYAKASDIVKQIQTLLTERGSVSHDERTNKTIIKDIPQVIKKAKELITKLDEPVKQVLIEAKIVEINTNFEQDLGIKWGGAAWQMNQASYLSIGNGGVISPQTNNFPSNLTNNINIDNPLTSNAIIDLGVAGTTNLGITLGRLSRHSAILLDLQLSAMEHKGVAKIISSPRILTMDHLEAEIQQGYKVPYLKQTQDGISTDFLDAGLTLKVIPHVTPDNRITLEITTEKSAPDWGNTVQGVPAIVSRSAKSTVLIDNGETIVIGGIKTEDISESHGSVPGVSRLPGIGNLFKNKGYQNNKAELLIFITARVVSSDVKDVNY